MLYHCLHLGTRKKNPDFIQHHQDGKLMNYTVKFINDLLKQIDNLSVNSTSFTVTIPLVNNQQILADFIKNPNENIDNLFNVLDKATIINTHTTLDWLKNNAYHIVLFLQIILTIILLSTIKITWKLLFKMVTLILILFSYLITYMRMIKEKQAERYATLTKLMNFNSVLPRACTPGSLSTFEVFKKIIKSFFIYKDDDCAVYFKNQQVNVYLEISPLQVLFDTGSRCIVKPLSYFGEACGHFLQNLFEKLPIYLYGPIFCLLILIVFSTQLMFFGYYMNIFNLINIGPHGRSKNQLALEVENINIQIKEIKLLLNNIHTQQICDKPSSNQDKIDIQ